MQDSSTAAGGYFNHTQRFVFIFYFCSTIEGKKKLNGRGSQSERAFCTTFPQQRGHGYGA
jgi:hypothetical protein